MPKRRRRVSAVLALVVGAFLLQIANAGAVFHRGPHPRTAERSNTDMRMSGTGAGGSVTGYIADLDNPWDSATEPYPATNPPQPTGWEAKNEGFAGIIHGTPVGGGSTLNLYCIDIRTNTYAGIGYTLGSWDAAGVPNVGLVARLLDDYYPNTDAPAGLTADQKAAAVQAAIWYFSDKYALRTTDPLHDEVADIVHAVQEKGPVPNPEPPSLTLTPASLSGTRHVLGPFTLATDAPPATVTATGGTMYSNARGTELIGNGTTAEVPSGQKIWLRPAGGSHTAVLQAVSTATVPSGNVYLYDGNTAGVDDAQRLILARPATLKTTVGAAAQFVPYGSLVVKKRISGPAAGSQGRVVIKADCTDGANRRPFVIRADAPRGQKTRTYRHIPAGTICTLTETSNGSSSSTDVTVVGDGQQAEIEAGGRMIRRIVDVYRSVPGSLNVRKIIAGPAAGQQGQVTIHTVCNGTALQPDLVVPAHAPAGRISRGYDNLPAGSECTVTETADGSSSTVSAVTEGSGQIVRVRAGEIVQADVTDTYGLAPGQLEVTKTIDGPAAGSQGQVVIHTVCDGTALTPDFVIPADTPAGQQSHLYSGIPTPASCVVTETANGATSAASVTVTGSPDSVTIPAGGAGAAHITDTYGHEPGSLLVSKTIAGPRAGHQGPVTIEATCDGVALSPNVVIPAGTAAGTTSHSFDDIPAGSACTVTELANGSTAKVEATVTGNGQTATIPAGGVAQVHLTDVYAAAPGAVDVDKRITGRAAHVHGQIGIVVSCGGISLFAIRIVPGTGSGLFRQHFDGIASGSRCSVLEVADGHTKTVRVTTTGRRRRVTVHAGVRATVRLKDVFSPRPPKPPKPSVTG